MFYGISGVYNIVIIYIKLRLICPPSCTSLLAAQLSVPVASTLCRSGLSPALIPENECRTLQGVSVSYIPSHFRLRLMHTINSLSSYAFDHLNSVLTEL